MNVRPTTYTALVRRAIAQEDAIMEHRADKKRKAPTAQSSGQVQRLKVVPTVVPAKAPQGGRLLGQPKMLLATIHLNHNSSD